MTRRRLSAKTDQKLTCRPLSNDVSTRFLRWLKFFVRSRPASAGIWKILASPAPHSQNFNPQALPIRPALFPSQTCHGKPLKTHATCFVAIHGNLFSGLFQNQRKFETVKPSQTSALLSQSTIEKVRRSLSNFLKFSRNCYSRHDHRHYVKSRSLEALVAITPNVFHWDLETPICGLATTGECLYTSYVKPEVCMRPSKLFIYNTTTVWLHFCNVKFDIFDAVVVRACLSCFTHC